MDLVIAHVYELHVDPHVAVAACLTLLGLAIVHAIACVWLRAIDARL